MSRRKVAVIVIVAVVLSSLGGWAAASRMRSPAEIAARTAPPTPSPILVPAESRTISADVVTRGTARFGSPQKLTTVPSALKATPGIVTDVPAVGTELREGDVVLTATGRPVFLLAGARLGVRDLGPGLVGEDVRQLEEALARLGFSPGTVDQVYDAATEAAVAAWYRSAGYTPFEATEDQRASIRARESELAKSRVELSTAQDGVATVGADAASARAAYADAVVAQAASPASVAAAQAQATADNAAADADVTAKSAALADLLAGEAPEPTAVAVAQAELAAAQAAAASTRSAGEKAVADALAAAVTADNAVLSAQVAMGAADQRVAIATSTAAGQAAVTDLAAQETDLERRRAGVQVPADEVVFAPATPVRVSELLAAPGDQIGGPLATVTNAVVAVDGALPLADATLVTPGMPVQIDEPDLGIAATGTVSQVAATPGTNGADGFHVWFETIVAGAPANLVGASLRLTVPVRSTNGDVLAVPTGAVSLAADGSSRVERDDGHGGTTSVRVEPGLSADGFVEVRPTDGSLSPGDLVVVGSDRSAGPTGQPGEPATSTTSTASTTAATPATAGG